MISIRKQSRIGRGVDTNLPSHPDLLLLRILAYPTSDRRPLSTDSYLPDYLIPRSEYCHTATTDRRGLPSETSSVTRECSHRTPRVEDSKALCSTKSVLTRTGGDRSRPRVSLKSGCLRQQKRRFGSKEVEGVIVKFLLTEDTVKSGWYFKS